MQPAPAQAALNQAESVVLDGSGNGTVRIGPDGPHEYWSPATAGVQAPNPAGGVPANEARCDIYVGPKVGPQYWVDGTYSGSSGVVSGVVGAYTIGRHADPYIFAVWTGGDPGATATLRVQGTKSWRQ